MAEEVGSQELRGVGQSQFSNVCLVPEWRVWRWPEIRRWGAPRKTADGLPTEEISSCPSDGRKAYWYKEEFRLRNRTTRLIDKATATHRGPEKPENVDTPGLLECYQTNGPQYGLCNPALPLQANPPPRTTQVSGF